MTLEERRSEASVKLERVADFLRREDLGGVLLRTSANFAWMTAGGSSAVALSREIGAVPLFIRDDGRRFFIASSSEAPRMLDEELDGMGYEWREIPWWTAAGEPDVLRAAVDELARGRPFAADVEFPGARTAGEAIAALRVPLTDWEVRKYRWLGERAGEAVDEVCRRIEPGMTERGIEALVSDALVRRAIQPTVLLVAADERVLKYRHPVPSDLGRLERYALVNVCARRWGLVVALSRLVHFGPLDTPLQTRLAAAARVNAGFWARTVPGASAGAIFSAAIADYAEAGFEGEWRRHHQGGAIGYRERDWLAVPGSGERVRAPQAFAWNPTVQGAKVEDTILVFEDRMEVLTEIAGWPVVESRVLGRVYRSPAILIR